VNRLVANIRSRFLNSPIRRLYKLKASYSIAAEILSAIDLQDCLKILVSRIASYMSVEIVSVMLIDDNKRRLIIKITKGLDYEVARDTGAGMEDSIAGWVAKTGEPLLIRDLDRDARFAKRSGGRYYNNSLLSVPLKLRNRIIGVINVNNKTSKDVFREYDLNLLKTVSDLSAVSIEVMRLEERADKSDKEHRELISDMTHDLKTPLATIKEALLLMFEGAGGALSEKHRKYVGISMQNVDRMVRMIDEMMLSNKAPGAKRGAKRNLFDVAGTARAILNSLDILAKKHSIVLKRVIPDKEIRIWGDPDKMNEVISNLVENAIKYNKPQGSVDVALEEDAKSVTISVRDTGMGIPKDDIGMVFDRYYRLNRDASGDIPGSGLGLAIVKEIIDMHKGNISVESEQDRGTKFTVTLPKDLRS